MKKKIKYICGKYKEFYRKGQFTLKDFDIESKLPKTELKHVDKYHYFLHRIYVGQHMNKKKDVGSWINLNNNHLRDVLTKRRTQQVKDFWISQGVIECNNYHQAGMQSKGYRFAESYRQAEMHVAPFIDERFKRTSDEKKKAYFSKPNDKYPNQVYLYENMLKLLIDIDAAAETMATKFKRVRKRFGKRNKYISSLNSFANLEYYFMRDSKGQRIHNSYVNLPKLLKHFLYLASGEELINIDIVNSQPLMLCILLLMQGIEGCEQYISDCENGVLYETLANAANIEIADRTKYKRRFFKRVLYGRNENACNKPEFKTFALLYPTVAAFVVEQKKHTHKQLAINLQRIESQIILDDVIAGIVNDKLNLFALTIHDSVTTTRSNETEITNRIVKAFAQYGVTPKLKTENL